MPPSAPFVAGLGFELWRRSEGRGECSDPPCATSDRTYRQSDESQPSTTAQAKGDPRDVAESTALRSSGCLCRWLHSWASAAAGSFDRFTDALTRSSHSLTRSCPGYYAASYES